MNSLESRVLQLIGENVDSPDVFTDDSTGMAQIRDSLNDAIEEVCMLTGSVRRPYHIPLESGKNFYQIDSARDNFAWPVSVWLSDQRRQLDQKEFSWFAWNNPRFLHATGTPQYFALLSHDKFAITPTPSSSVDMLVIDAVVIPDRYTEDTDRIKLRDSFQWAVVNYAVSEYWASRGDARQAIKHFLTYLQELGFQELNPEAFERYWEFKTK